MVSRAESCVNSEIDLSSRSPYPFPNKQNGFCGRKIIIKQNKIKNKQKMYQTIEIFLYKSVSLYACSSCTAKLPFFPQ